MKHGDESASPADKKSSLLEDKSGEGQEAEGESDAGPISRNVDPAPSFSASTSKHAGVNEPARANQDLPPGDTPVPDQDDNGSA